MVPISRDLKRMSSLRPTIANDRIIGARNRSERYTPCEPPSTNPDHRHMICSRSGDNLIQVGDNVKDIWKSVRRTNSKSKVCLQSQSPSSQLELMSFGWTVPHRIQCLLGLPLVFHGRRVQWTALRLSLQQQNPEACLSNPGH